MEESRGTFYLDGEYRKGIYYSDENRFEENENVREEILYIPKPVNAHTHIGDSFIKEEPVGTLAEVVGPGGFKLRRLKSSDPEVLIGSIKNSINYMKGIGTGTFIDFREAGSSSMETIKAMRSSHPGSIILGRPENLEGLEKMKELINGIGFSAVSDDDNDLMISLGKRARNLGLIVSTHYSENRQEPIEPLYELKPDLLIHCTALGRNKLQSLKSITNNVAITPRSNFFFNIRPDYKMFLEEDINLMLGTDNVMTVNPNIFEEMDFLFRIQKNLNRIEPEEIMKMAFHNSFKFMKKSGIRNGENWIKFMGRIPSPYQIVTKFHLLNPVEIDFSMDAL